MPRVDIVQKHNTAARRLFIRGHNGKIYPYLVVNDSGLGDARREERVLQLLRMLNHYLGKQKVAAVFNQEEYFVFGTEVPGRHMTRTPSALASASSDMDSYIHLNSFSSPHIRAFILKSSSRY
jgi:hypothetical protein